MIIVVVEFAKREKSFFSLISPKIFFCFVLFIELRAHHGCWYRWPLVVRTIGSQSLLFDRGDWCIYSDCDHFLWIHLLWIIARGHFGNIEDNGANGA